MESTGTNADWGDPEEAVPRRRIPVWAWWGCGGGCLLIALLAVGMTVFGIYLAKEGRDPEVQWPRLRSVLAFEERPEGLEIELGLSLGADQFRLIDREKGQLATLIEFSAAANARYEELFEPEQQMPLGVGQPLEGVVDEVVVQGRAVRCLHFVGMKREIDTGYKAGIRLDLTGPRAKPRTLEIRHASPQKFEEEEVEAFLAPFDVWRDP